MLITGSTIKVVATMSKDVLTVTVTACPVCGHQFSVRLQQCDGGNSLALCPSCNGSCAVAMSIKEDTGTLRSRAFRQIDVDGIDVTAHGRVLTVSPGGSQVKFAIAWKTHVPEAPIPASIQPSLPIPGW